MRTVSPNQLYHYTGCIQLPNAPIIGVWYSSSTSTCREAGQYENRQQERVQFIVISTYYIRQSTGTWS